MCFKNKNFYVYNIRRDCIDAVHVSSHAEPVGGIEFLTNTGRQLITLSDKLCYARTTNSGAWSFKTLDIADELPFHSSAHLNDQGLLKEF